MSIQQQNAEVGAYFQQNSTRAVSQRQASQCHPDYALQFIAACAARGLDWPRPYTGRALRNAFVDSWDGREAELRTGSVVRDRRLEEVIVQIDQVAVRVCARSDHITDSIAAALCAAVELLP